MNRKRRQLMLELFPRRDDDDASGTPKGRGMAKVMRGDAFDLLNDLGDDSVDLIVTSPPYWGLRSYGLRHDWEIGRKWAGVRGHDDEIPTYEWYRDNGGVLGLEPNPDWYIAHLVEFFAACRRVVRPHGSMWINLGDTYFARWSSIRENGRQGLGGNPRVRRRVPMGGYRQEKQLLMIPARFAIQMQDHRWILRNDLIWHKPNVPPRPERDRLRLAHEHFFHFVHRPTQGRAKYYYDMSATEPEGNDVVTYNVRAGQDNHTATFPEDLIRPRIISSCPPDGTLLDPFCGSGRSLLVAVEEGRNAVGFDLVEKFATAAEGLVSEDERSE